MPAKPSDRVCDIRFRGDSVAKLFLDWWFGAGEELDSYPPTKTKLVFTKLRRTKSDSTNFLHLTGAPSFATELGA
jgi:hypothetical protein